MLKSGSRGATLAQQPLPYTAAELLWSAGRCGYSRQGWYTSLSKTLGKLWTKCASCIIRLWKCLIWMLNLRCCFYWACTLWWSMPERSLSAAHQSCSLFVGTRDSNGTGFLFWDKIFSRKAFAVWSVHTTSSAADVESEPVSTCRTSASVTVYSAWRRKRKILE